MDQNQLNFLKLLAWVVELGKHQVTTEKSIKEEVIWHDVKEVVFAALELTNFSGTLTLELKDGYVFQATESEGKEEGKK